jgi:hypothetical protein
MSSKDKRIRLVPGLNSLPMIRVIAELERLMDFSFAVGLYSDYCFQNQTALVKFVGPRLLKDHKIDLDQIPRKQLYEYFDRISPARTRWIELALSYSRVVDVFLVYLKDMISLSIYAEAPRFYESFL